MADDLLRRGVEVLDRNWHGGGGELDLVVRHADRLRFVEVKARRDDGIDPLEALDAGKRRRLVHAAEAWLAAHGPPDAEVAFLVAVVDLSTTPWTVRYLDDAFDGG